MKLDSAVDNAPALLNEDTSSPTAGEVLTVVGYGTTTEGGVQSSILQEVAINYIPTDMCNVKYSGKINGATMMCAGVGGGKTAAKETPAGR
jgi:trypsin